MREIDMVRLLDRAQQGDEDAVADVLAFVTPRLRRYLARRLRDRDLAADVRQEALWRVWRGLPGCQATSAGQLVRWALTITQRALVDLCRAEGPTRHAARDLASATAEDVAAEAPEIGDPVVRAAAVAAARAAAALPGAAGFLLWYRVLHGATWAEVAAVLGTTPAAAKRRFQRVQRRLATAVRTEVCPLLGRPPPGWLAPPRSPKDTSDDVGPCPRLGAD